jgi:hypothetical protein
MEETIGVRAAASKPRFRNSVTMYNISSMGWKRRPVRSCRHSTS